MVMTASQIEALTDDQLTKAIADRILGWKPYPVTGEWGWRRPDGQAVWKQNFRPCTDRAAATKILLGISTPLMQSRVLTFLAEKQPIGVYWWLLTISPRKLMEAVLAAALAS